MECKGKERKERRGEKERGEEGLEDRMTIFGEDVVGGEQRR